MRRNLLSESWRTDIRKVALRVDHLPLTNIQERQHSRSSTQPIATLPQVIPRRMQRKLQISCCKETAGSPTASSMHSRLDHILSAKLGFLCHGLAISQWSRLTSPY